MKLAVEDGQIALKDGTVLDGKIMYEDDLIVYIETEDGIVNVEKSEILETSRS